MAFKQLKEVDKKHKYAVYGWIRNKEKTLRIQNVPAMVTAICILYYREFEVFDQDLIHPDLNVDNKYRTISLKSGLYGGSAFGINIAKRGREYHWRIKIENDECGGPPSMNIGIFAADLANKWLGDAWWVHKNGYSYFKSGSIWNEDMLGRAYGGQHKPGDIIDIWLDLKNYDYLSYAKNGENYGKAFDIGGHINYRLALDVKKGKATIQSFQVIY